jgi:hypothetical protein
MNAVTSPQLEPAVITNKSSIATAPAGKTDARLTASPHFASGVNQSASTNAGIAEPPARAGKRGQKNGVNQAQVIVPPEHVAEIAPFLVQLGVNLEAPRSGRKHVFDDFLRGRLVSLLAMGLSIRQSAAALGLSHVAVWKELKRNPELEEQVNAARYQAQVEPLLVILRESKRSWRAATWVLNYLQRQIKEREETPDETRRRQREERDEDHRRWDEQTDKQFERNRKARAKAAKEAMRKASLAQLMKIGAPYRHLNKARAKQSTQDTEE